MKPLRPGYFAFVVVLLGALSAALIAGHRLVAQTPSQVASSTQPGHLPYHFHHVHIVAGGFVTGILFHPTVPELAYLRTDIGGAYRWDAKDERWTSLSEWIPASESNLLGVESMAVDPAHPDDLYLAVGTYTHPGVPNGALLRSHDRGAHFAITRLPFQLGGNEPGRFAGERLALDPAHPGSLYLGTRNNGLWHSSDRGVTWSQMANFPGQSNNGIGVVFEVFGPKGTDGAARDVQPVYVGVSTLSGPTLFVSTDNGAHWHPVEGAPTGMLPYHAAFTADGTLYLTCGNAPGPNDVSAGAVWKRTPESGRTGGSWQQITPEATATNPRGFAYAGLALDPHYPDTVVVSTLDRWQPGDTLFASADRGEHWTSLTEKAVRDASRSPYLVHFGKLPFGHWIGAVAIDPHDANHVLYGTGETLWASDDFQQALKDRPTHWNVGAEGIEETAVINLLAPSAGAPLFPALGDIGCFRADSVAAGNEAVALEPPALSNCDAVAVAGAKPQVLAMVGRVWTGDHHGGFSVDGGNTWQPFPSEPAEAVGGGSAAINADGSAFFWVTDAGAFVSRDHGATWQTVSSVKRPQLVADSADPQRVYVLPRDGGDLMELRFGQNGAAPAQQALLHGVSAGTRVVADGRRRRLYLFGKDGLRVVDTESRAVRDVTREARVSAFGVGAPLTSGGPEMLFFAGQLRGKDGIYRSADDGRSWQHIDDAEHGFGEIGVLAGDPRVPGRVFLGTNGLGVIVAEPAH